MLDRQAAGRSTALLILTVVLLIRLPSLVEPAGGDQGLYAYVGQRILHGELPYRDAWDQKPPAIHYTYAALWRVWPHESVVTGVDILAAMAGALLLARLARRIVPLPGAGLASAILFLLLANPAFTRLGGVRIRAQCETFIAVLVAAALVLVARAAWRPGDPGRNGLTTEHTENIESSPFSVTAVASVVRTPRPVLWTMAAGVLIGAAATFKYNAAIYGIVAGMSLPLWRADRNGLALRDAFRHLGWLGFGFATPIVLMVVVFSSGGALDDLYQATIAYNVWYSGDTYAGARSFMTYLASFPVRMARVDPLWMLGGLGSATLLAFGLRQPALVIPPVWVATACLSIAINSSRHLPQYFVQAAPPLALAAGVAGVVVWRATRPFARLAIAALLVMAVSRNLTFEKVIEYTRHDLRYLRGDIGRPEYLAKFGGRPGDKFSAAGVEELARYVNAHTTRDETILIFGFSGGAYVQAGRKSASRFFWSYPVISGFHEGRAGYGAAGLLDELMRNRPRLVVLQQHDWDPDGPDSETFFLSHAALAAWLRTNYVEAGQLRDYAIWTKRSNP
ncbi:MAG: hypothetical protein HYX76_07975 [Acidobacteria bacterium]|nr:hypothetical protein [Acidobacteriota bacterium]